MCGNGRSRIHGQRHGIAGDIRSAVTVNDAPVAACIGGVGIGNLQVGRSGSADVPAVGEAGPYGADIFLPLVGYGACTVGGYSE